jgi:hypothetical protein
MPGETFLAPPTKIRAFLSRSGIGKLAGIGPVASPGGHASEMASAPSPRRARPLRRSTRL